ncbi:hypothetical protein NITHO_6170001 [Nitrolancea hollandica Lb]|uniref:Uncharacterized protein n=1 Tax=Nitrolancea hollandica Lb TaxID=1129897 RepID=I4EML1_9BACT|nr:hypothetical protein NITHO_6170001 [Nitrolancea hollandica Lb]
MAQFAYPSTDGIGEITEDDKPHTIQYFERAVFEWHSVNQVHSDALAAIACSGTGCERLTANLLTNTEGQGDSDSSFLLSFAPAPYATSTSTTSAKLVGSGIGKPSSRMPSR